MNPKLGINTYEYLGKPLNEASYDLSTQNYLNEVIYYGYDYPGHQTQNYYMATQALIWEKISGYLIEFYTERYGYGNYIDVSYEKNEILRLINEPKQVPYFIGNQYDYTLIDYAQFEDEALKNFEIAESNWQDITIDGNTIKIKNLKNFVGTINIKLKRKNYRQDTAMYYYETETQPLITGGKIDNEIYEFSVNIHGAKIKLNKIDYDSKKPLAGIEFGLYALDEIGNNNGNIHYQKDQLIKTGITDNDGHIVFDDLVFGLYYLKEINTLEAYTNPGFIFKIPLFQEEHELTIENELKKASIIIHKFGKLFETGTLNYNLIPLENVEFKLYANEDIISPDGTIYYHKNDIVNILQTDINGTVEFSDLVLGEYCIVETKTVDGYKLDSSPNCYDLKIYGGMSIEMTNYFKQGHLKIKKIDDESKLPIKDNTIKFNVKNVDTGEYIYLNGSKDLFLNENGELIINNLPYGKYEIKEVSTSLMYELNKNTTVVDINEETLNGDNTVEIEFYNSLKKGKITLKKYGEKFNYKEFSSSYALLKDIEFTLYADEDITTLDGVTHYHKGDIVLTKKTNDKGLIEFDNLILGNYCLVETHTLDNYEIDTNKYCFNLKDKQEQSIELQNDLKKGTLKLTKLDSNSKLPIKDNTIKFNIKNIATNRYIYLNGSKDLSLNENGELIINNLPYGKYEVKEIKTSLMYELNKNTTIVDINEGILNSDNTVEIEFYNTLKKGKITLKKYGEKFNYKEFSSSYALLKDIEFTLYADEDITTLDGVTHYHKGDIVLTKKTNDKGLIEFDNLILGNYCLVETQTLDDYEIDTNKYCFNLKDKQEQSIELQNDLKKGTLKLTKLDSNSKLPINDNTIKFNIKNIATNRYIYLNGSKDLSLNENGELIINNLPYGKYEVKEIKTSLMYELNKNTTVVDINEETLNSDNTVEIEFYNTLKKGKITLKKYGEKFNYKEFSSSYDLLKDIEFTIYANEDITTLDGVTHYHMGDIVLTKKTNDKGLIEFDNLILGNYCLIETHTLDNYEIDTNKYCFNLKDKQEQSIELKNNLKKGKLIIRKIDALTNEPLANVTFKIYHDKVLLGTFKTDKNGIIELEKLPLTVYKVIESKTLDDYILDKTERIIDLNLEQEIVVENNKRVILPNTLKKDYSLIISNILFVLGTVLMIKNEFKKKLN